MKKTLVDKCAQVMPCVGFDLQCLTTTPIRIALRLRRATKLARALSNSHYAKPGARASGAWSIERAAVVKAPTPPVPGLIQLGLVDTELYMVGGPCNGAMFFAAALDSDHLQHTLAAALEAFPILAGRVVSLPSADGSRRSRQGQWRRGFPRAVECNNAGAVRVLVCMSHVACRCRLNGLPRTSRDSPC